MDRSTVSTMSFVSRRIGELVQAIQSAERELQALIGGHLDAGVAAGDVSDLLRGAEERRHESGFTQRSLPASQVAILDALPAHIALLDSTGIVVAVNEAWRRYGRANSLKAENDGVGSDYLATCAWDGEVPGEGGRQVAAGIRAVLDGRLDQFSLEYPCDSPDARHWFRLSVTPLGDGRDGGAVVMHVDITEQRLSALAIEEAVEEQRHLATQLAAERERLLAAQAVAKVGSWETDLDSFEVMWSEETYRIFGIDPSRKDITHATFLQLVHPEDQAEVDAEFRDSLTSPDIRSVEHRIVLADGSVKNVEERWYAIRNESGRPHRAVGTCQDITARKVLEAQFYRAQRLESVGTLAGGIAHDINNVLVPILASIETLRMDMRESDQLNTLSIMETSARRGAELVRQVLTFARGSEGEPLLVNPGRVAREVERILRETFPKGISVQLHVEDSLWAVRGDPTQLHQVLMNLCVNARDAMPLGGTLGIALSNTIVDEDFVALNSQARVGRYVRIAVSDTGTGIAPEIRERLFEPFFTTKELGKGTGLGLSTVHSIAGTHGGFVDVSSELGRGTRLTVFLPARREVIADPPPPVPALLPRGNGEQILVVDDEAPIRNVVRRMLERFGYRVLLADNGAEGLSVYREHRDSIAAVLTDMAMPVMDGAAMIVALRAVNPEVRILASSGLGADDDVSKAVGSGLVEFVAKPYSTEVLLTALRRILQREPC